MTSPIESIKRFGPGALATPANFVTLGRLLFAVPTLLLIARDGESWLASALWFALCDHRRHRRLARPPRRHRRGRGRSSIRSPTRCSTLGGFVALVARATVWWLPVVIMAAREVWISVYRSVGPGAE